MIRLNKALFAAAAMAMSPSFAQAADYLNLNVGYFDVVRQKDTAALFGAEYRFDPIKWGIGPMVGGFVTTDGGAYGYAGLHWDLPVTNQFYIIPSFAAGGYHIGNGKDLGGPISFRTGIEFDYQFANAQRLGLGFNHMSNADLYSHNQSTENALVTYSIPIASLVQWAVE